MICKINNAPCNNCTPVCDKKMEDRKKKMHSILENHGNKMFEIGYREGYLKALEDVLEHELEHECTEADCSGKSCVACYVEQMKQKFQGDNLND